MNGYVVAGYVISIGSLVFYGVLLALRARAAHRRAMFITPTETAAKLADATQDPT